jgi:hypothetical protein
MSPKNKSEISSMSEVSVSVISSLLCPEVLHEKTETIRITDKRFINRVFM